MQLPDLLRNRSLFLNCIGWCTIIALCLYLVTACVTQRHNRQAPQFSIQRPKPQQKEAYLLYVLDEFLLETAILCHRERIDPNDLMAPAVIVSLEMLDVWIKKLQGIWNLFKAIENVTLDLQFISSFRHKIGILNAMSSRCLRLWCDRFNRMPEHYKETLHWREQIKGDPDWMAKHS